MHPGPYPNQNPETAARVRAIHKAAAKRRAALERRWHTIYKLYDDKDRLLYVGISANGLARFYEHRNNKRWWRRVTRAELEHVKGRTAAEERERELIQTLDPRHNVVGKERSYPDPRTIPMHEIWTDHQKNARVLKCVHARRCAPPLIAELTELPELEVEEILARLHELGRVRPYRMDGAWEYIQ